MTQNRAWRRASVVLFALLVAVMTATALDYGMTGDEGIQHRYGRKLLRSYGVPGTEPGPAAEGDMLMYGGLFEILAELAVLASPLDPYETRHLATVAFALLAFFGAWRMGARLGGERGGFLALLFLVLTPPFYGHAFNNPKDVPFAGTFTLALLMILRASDGWPTPSWRRFALAGAAIGLTAGVRVAGLVLFAHALLLWSAVLLARTERKVYGLPCPGRHSLARLGGGWLLALVIGWAVMLVFWPWAQSAPFRAPLVAWRAFSYFWGNMILFYDGAYVLSGEVSRFYLLRYFSLTLPELYAPAGIAGALWLAFVLARRRLLARLRVGLLQALWLAFVAAAPVLWIVWTRTPLYDGLRHFLFVMPALAALGGAGAAAYWQTPGRRSVKAVLATTLCAACTLTLADMVALHPYQAVYFNRLVAGGLRGGIARYEGDYWCLTYKECSEWLMRRYAGAACTEKIRVAGQSIPLQTAYYFQKTEEGLSRFRPVGLHGQPHFIMTTTRFGDHILTPGRLVHTVERQGAQLGFVFETKQPPCE